MTMPRIRQLLETRLNTWAAARNPALPIAWQNKTFDPPSSGSYLRAFILPAPTDSDDLKGDHRKYTGVFQVSVVAPRDTGPGAAESIAEEIAALFPMSQTLTIASPAFSLQMTSPMQIARGIDDADKHVVPVSAQYRADDI